MGGREGRWRILTWNDDGIIRGGESVIFADILEVSHKQIKACKPIPGPATGSHELFFFVTPRMKREEADGQIVQVTHPFLSPSFFSAFSPSLPLSSFLYSQSSSECGISHYSDS